MSEAEHILETRRWLKYAGEDLHTAQVIINEQTIACRHGVGWRNSPPKNPSKPS